MDEMARKQSDINRVPVELLDEFEVGSFTLKPAGGQPVIDVVVKLLSADQTESTHRIRLGPRTAIALANDLRVAAMRAEGSPPTTH